jgi:predicted ATPase
LFNYIRIEGFRSFKRVELDLSPLSVLIGPNSSGKSNFLDLMSLMAEAGEGHLGDAIARRGGYEGAAFRGEPGDIFVEFRFKAEGVFEEERADVRFKLGLRRVGLNPRVWVEQVTKDPDPRHPFPLQLMKRDKDGCLFRSLRTGMIEELSEDKALESDSELAIFQVRDRDKYPTPYKILRELQEWILYRDIDVGPEAPVRMPALVRPTFRLAPNASNLSSVLNSIQQQRPALWEEIGELLKTAHPDFHSITFPPEGGDGKVVLRWWERPYEKRSGFSANFLSDGTLKFLCLIAILKGPDPPPLICIDEPELGLHPDWIKLVAELLQSAASRTQVIVATHSPHIVARLEPDQVVVTERVGGETNLTRLGRDDLGRWLQEFNLAELWLAGHFGGRP